MSIDYTGKTPCIVLSVKSDSESENRYDLFPPLLFCKSASDVNRRYLRGQYVRALNTDHPYMAWLLDNAEKLNTYFHRQFQQIMESLYFRLNPQGLIATANNVRAQLLSFKERHGIDMSKCPELSEKDFLTVEDK